jgi:hypothetical protein
VGDFSQERHTGTGSRLASICRFSKGWESSTSQSSVLFGPLYTAFYKNKKQQKTKQNQKGLGGEMASGFSKGRHTPVAVPHRDFPSC